MACQVLFDGGAIRSGHSAIIATTPQEAFPQQLLIGELLLPVRPAASRKPVENSTNVGHRAFRLLAFRVLHVSFLIVASSGAVGIALTTVFIVPPGLLHLR
jgi:hypothetical protein